MQDHIWRDCYARANQAVCLPVLLHHKLADPFSAFSSERIDERFFIGCKLEPAFRKIACQHFALHRQRIDGNELQCAILLSSPAILLSLAFCVKYSLLLEGIHFTLSSNVAISLLV